MSDVSFEHVSDRLTIARCRCGWWIYAEAPIDEERVEREHLSSDECRLPS